VSVLDTGRFLRTRRNHATEHATIHLLTPKYRGSSLAGRADANGFYLYGRVETDDVRSAVHEAIGRLPGEPELAIHPRCGTNVVVTGLMAGLASLLAVATMPQGRRRGSTFSDTLPRLLVAGSLAAFAGAGLGPTVQERYTTSPDTRGVTVKEIRRIERGKTVIHRVVLDGP
jgi:hypothetical protein